MALRLRSSWITGWLLCAGLLLFLLAETIRMDTISVTAMIPRAPGMSRPIMAGQTTISQAADIRPTGASHNLQLIFRLLDVCSKALLEKTRPIHFESRTGLVHCAALQVYVSLDQQEKVAMR